jgi:uncharacterized lipoprotein YbaY
LVPTPAENSNEAMTTADVVPAAGSTPRAQVTGTVTDRERMALPPRTSPPTSTNR